MNPKYISQLWLKNIKKLDTKNKLRHGEIYAKDGSISDFSINNNIVKAKVMGAPGDVYDVEIEFEKFTKLNIEYLTLYISNNFNIFSKLLNHQIDEELLHTKVKILPSSLKDFKMSCSCAKGLFCKHKAAVFHKIAYEIEKDPFLVFTLLNFNIKNLFLDENLKIKCIGDVLRNDDSINIPTSNNMDYMSNFELLLTNHPIFYHSNEDFKEILIKTLQSMSKCSRQIQNPVIKSDFIEYVILGNSLKTFEYFSSKSPEEIKNVFENKWHSPNNWKDFKIDINGNYEIIKIDNGEEVNIFQTGDLSRYLFAFFAELKQVDFSKYNDNIKYLFEIFNFTLQLINLNALIPDIFSLESKKHHIRWIPVFEKDIYNHVEKLADDFPEDIITFNAMGLKKHIGVVTLISLFFEGFCKYYVNKFIPHSLSAYIRNTFFRLFFLKSQDFDNFRYKNAAVEVNNWISPLMLKQKDYSFIINISQDDYEFVFDLKIKIDDDIHSFEYLVLNKRFDVINDLTVIKEIFAKYGIKWDLANMGSMDLRDFSSFMDVVAPALESQGIEINPPEEFTKINNAKLVLESDFADNSLTLNDLSDFNWRIAIGDETFSVDDFKTFAQNYRGLVEIGDKYYVIDEDNLRDIYNDISNIPENKSKSDLIKYLLSSKSDNVEIDEKLMELKDNLLDIGEIEPPKSLNAKLRPYQEVGFSWMIQNIKLGFGSILADDMGLGKTIQLLSVVSYLKQHNLINEKKVLIVVPTSILTNWYREIEKFTPSLKAEIYHINTRTIPENDYDILLTSYSMVRQDIKKFIKIDWLLVVVDEAQNIKNPKTKQTKALKALNADYHIALSGTPIENHLSEYWSIFDFINKGYLFSLKEFKKRFIKPIEKNDADTLSDFRKITSPFILRRLKSDKSIVKDLPDKLVNDIYCNLTLKQATLYEESLNKLILDVEDSSGIQRKGLVLKLINSLKQICNHPSQFIKVDDAKIADSGKMEVLINILQNVLDEDGKILIFTQYVEMGKIMKKLIEEKFLEEVLFLHGGLSRSKRDELIDKFQNGEPKIFILSLKAGGIGLNLTAATHVVHYDLWWNPAVENQATDRAYRIGQKENVFVYRFITTGTLEESINQILSSKEKLVDMTIGNGESFITEMSNDELREMLYLRDNFGN